MEAAEAGTKRMTIYVLPPWTLPIGQPINVTSNSASFGRYFSPFILGPVDLYSGYVSLNVENAWQYSKVYEQFNDNGKPNQEYWDWAEAGWLNKRAERYPMGKGSRPRYSWWSGKSLSYVEARKKIYVPLYREAVMDSGDFPKLQEYVNKYEDITIMDYDAYNHKQLGMTLDDVLNEPNRKMGHGFVLAMMLEEVM